MCASPESKSTRWRYGHEIRLWLLHSTALILCAPPDDGMAGPAGCITLRCRSFPIRLHPGGLYAHCSILPTNSTPPPDIIFLGDLPTTTMIIAPTAAVATYSETTRTCFCVCTYVGIIKDIQGFKRTRCHNNNRNNKEATNKSMEQGIGKGRERKCQAKNIFVIVFILDWLVSLVNIMTLKK